MTHSCANIRRCLIRCKSHRYSQEQQSHSPVDVQIQGAGFAMVGEQMPVSLGVTASDALTDAEVAIKAEYLEGGGHSELQVLVINGDGTQALQVGCP